MADKRAGLLYITVVREDDTIIDIDINDLTLNRLTNDFEAIVDGDKYFIDLNDVTLFGWE